MFTSWSVIEVCRDRVERRAKKCDLSPAQPKYTAVLLYLCWNNSYSNLFEKIETKTVQAKKKWLGIYHQKRRRKNHLTIIYCWRSGTLVSSARSENLGSPASAMSYLDTFDRGCLCSVFHIECTPLTRAIHTTYLALDRCIGLYIRPYERIVRVRMSLFLGWLIRSFVCLVDRRLRRRYRDVGRAIVEWPAGHPWPARTPVSGDNDPGPGKDPGRQTPSPGIPM